MPYMAACQVYADWCSAATPFSQGGGVGGAPPTSPDAHAHGHRRHLHQQQRPGWATAHPTAQPGRALLSSGHGHDEDTTGLAYYCSDGGVGGDLPSMLMYFHSRFSEVVLWKEWVPRTQGE